MLSRLFYVSGNIGCLFFLYLFLVGYLFLLLGFSFAYSFHWRCILFFNQIPGIKGVRSLGPPSTGFPPCSSYASGKRLSSVLNLTARASGSLSHILLARVYSQCFSPPFHTNAIKPNKSINNIIETSMCTLDDLYLGWVGFRSCILLMAEAHGQRPYWCRL